MKVKIQTRFLLISVTVVTAALIFLFCGLVLQTSAATHDELTYTVTDGSVTITDCDTNATGHMEIPAEIEGCPVVAIGESAFQDCIGLTGVTVPESVTSIGSSAFSGCTELATVDYNAINSTTQGSDSSSAAFLGCDKLTVANIGNNITEIPAYLFYGCSSLSSVSIPESVTSIGNFAFFGCSSLTGITIPEGVTNIGSSAFKGCTELTSVDYNAISSTNSSTGGSSAVFFGCGKLATLNFGDNVTRIPSFLFFGCSSLTNITIPESVTSIGDSAFYICSGLTGIDIPSRVTSIGNFAFFGCTGLQSVTIPDSVTSIGYGAFLSCTGLTTMTIPKNINSLGYAVFYECSSLGTIYYNATNCSTVQIEEGLAFLSGCINLTTIIIGDNVTSIPDYAFSGCPSLEKAIFLGNGRISLGEKIFNESNNVTVYCRENSFLHSYAETNNKKVCIIGSDGTPEFEVKNDVLISYIGNSPTVYVSAASKIGFGAFEGNEAIQTVELSSGVERIYNSAFKSCRNLSKIIIPQSVASIGESAFNGCNGLTIFCYSGTYAEQYAVNHKIPVTYITLSVSKSVVQMGADESIELIASFSTPLTEPQSIQWSSQDASIVSVNASGVISAENEGVTTVTALSENGLTATCSVVVRGPNTNIKINSTSSSFTQKVSWFKSYSSAPIQLKFKSINIDGALVKWTSDNSRVKVNQNGKVTNTSIFARSATITVTVYDSRGNEIVSDSQKVSFYKFSWQKSKLQSQSIISNNVLMQDTDEDTLNSIETQQSTNPITACWYKICDFFDCIFSKYLSGK